MRTIIIILSAALLTSCGLHKSVVDFNYRGESNYKNFYVVDTIKIDDPIIIWYRGNKFISSRLLFEKTKINNNFFQRPDVFLLGFDFYYDLGLSDFENYSYPDDGNCSETVNFNSLNKKHIAIQEYINKPVYFVLCLINANYFNKKHNTLDGGNYQIKNNDPKNSFYKIIYPICK